MNGRSGEVEARFGTPRTGARGNPRHVHKRVVRGMGRTVSHEEGMTSVEYESEEVLRTGMWVAFAE